MNRERLSDCHSKLIDPISPLSYTYFFRVLARGFENKILLAPLTFRPGTGSLFENAGDLTGDLKGHVKSS